MMQDHDHCTEKLWQCWIMVVMTILLFDHGGSRIIHLLSTMQCCCYKVQHKITKIIPKLYKRDCLHCGLGKVSSGGWWPIVVVAMIDQYTFAWVIHPSGYKYKVGGSVPKLKV